MTIIITTPKGQYRLSSLSLSFITFLFCCMIVLAVATLLLGVSSQLLVLMSPFLINAGMTLLQFSTVSFLSYRVLLWFWRLGIRRAWMNSYADRRVLVLFVRQQLSVLLKFLTIILFH